MANAHKQKFSRKNAPSFQTLRAKAVQYTPSFEMARVDPLVVKIRGLGCISRKRGWCLKEERPIFPPMNANTL
jgi:hypothetical protein